MGSQKIATYQRAGYRAIERYNDNLWATNFFEKSSNDSAPRG